MQSSNYLLRSTSPCRESLNLQLKFQALNFSPLNALQLSVTY